MSFIITPLYKAKGLLGQYIMICHVTFCSPILYDHGIL